MSLVDPYQDYLVAESTFSRLAEAAATVLSYATFNEDVRPMPIMFDTGLIYPGDGTQIGDPGILRYFEKIKFGGSGRLFVRVLVDKTEVARGHSTLSEDPYGANWFRLPVGTSGYGIRIQAVGNAWWRWHKIIWCPVSENESEDEK